MKEKLKNLTKTSARFWLAWILFLILLVVFCVITGGKRGDVALYGYVFTEDENTVVLDVGMTSSTGYLRTLEMKQLGSDLYITFYSTYGINSSIGAKHLFPINIDKNCETIYFYQGSQGFRPVLKKNPDSGEWARAD